jgi:hypothetical protein
MSDQRKAEEAAFVHGIVSRVSEILIGKMDRGEHPYLEDMTQTLLATTIYYEDGTVETVRASDDFAIIADPRKPIKKIVPGEHPSGPLHRMLTHLEPK